MVSQVVSDVRPAPGGRDHSTRLETTFRRDIQGLRAIAVLTVALDHAHVPGFSGGFVGVDVFFVISGFLITQLLLTEAQRTGGVSLPNFYSRRARRILPAATLVTVVTTLASVLLLDFVRATAVISDALWTAFFAANIKFGREGTDYFAADNPPSPLQHYWSLAIEEQFYIVWPVLLACLFGGYALWRRRRGAGRDQVGTAARISLAPVGITLALLGGCSLAGSITLTGRDPTAAYFSTSARVWELAVGAACAVFVPGLTRLNGPVKAAIAWAGLLCIGVAVFGYSATTPFPGRAALLPVAGAAMILAGGCGLVAGGPDLLLRHKPFQLVGDWSYSFYLWHWPFLVIAAGYLGHALPWQANGVLLVVALATSYVTYRWVENPIRRQRPSPVSRRRGLLLYPVAIALTLVACLGAHTIVGREIAAAGSAPAITTEYFGAKHASLRRFSKDASVALVQASALAAENGVEIPGDLSPPLLELGDDLADLGECDYEDDDIRSLCERGAVGSDRVLVLYGDSHARHWIPALDRIANRTGYAAYYLVKPGCGVPQLTTLIEAGRIKEDCIAWQAWAREQISELHPDLTIVSNDMTPDALEHVRRAQPMDTTVADAILRSLDQTLAAVKAGGGRVVEIADVPGLRRGPGSCLASRGATLAGCANHPGRLWASGRRIAETAAEDSNVALIDPVRWFCAYHLCPAVIGSFVTYRDGGHISSAYAEHLAGDLGVALGMLKQGAGGRRGGPL